MKTVLLLGSGVIGLLGVARLAVYLVGRSQPEQHTATIRFSVHTTISEDGFVKSPFFRGGMKLIVKRDATMRDFEKHFTAHLATR